MKLETNKVFGTKLTAEQIEKIEQILAVSKVNLDDLKTRGDVLNVILDNFPVNPTDEAEKSDVNTVNTEKVKGESEVNMSVNQDNRKVNTEQVKPEVKFNLSEQLSPFHKELISDYIQNEKVVNFFEKVNNEGKFDGVYNPINTENEEENILNLLTGVFTGSVNRMILEKNIVSEKEVKQRINDFVSKKE